ncbi:MAG: hypothetical protein F6J97_25545 [Leptolyngbya sp. SIO4C1]|nr:hypothetical protein [Leptolyngbya sp. SIO4C1]
MRAEFLGHYTHLRNERGRQGVVRNGYLPERTIMTGVGEVEVKVPKVHDRPPPTNTISPAIALHIPPLYF